MNVPFVDLKAQYHDIKTEINHAIQSVINETAFIRGKYVEAFEEEYAEACDVKHCISCANGTDAIYISLMSLGMGHGDEVITAANSWISTSETISQAGAKPVFVDIEPDYYTIDTSKIEEKITSRTKAVIPVHLYGQPAAIDKIKDICEAYKLYLIEDCAQAHFAEYFPYRINSEEKKSDSNIKSIPQGKGQKVGTFGCTGAFSFYPGKNLGAYGDAGAIITNDDDLAKKIRMFANHGSLKKHQHEMEGINSRMDGLQTAILSVKLPYIHEWNRKRHEHALLYNELLKDFQEIITPKIRPNASHIFHLYVVRSKNRNDLKRYLEKHGIQTSIHYPTALPFLKAYEYLGHKPEDFPIAYQYQNEILSLPLYPELLPEQIMYVTNRISDFITL